MLWQDKVNLCKKETLFSAVLDEIKIKNPLNKVIAPFAFSVYLRGVPEILSTINYDDDTLFNPQD